MVKVPSGARTAQAKGLAWGQHFRSGGRVYVTFLDGPW